MGFPRAIDEAFPLTKDLRSTLEIVLGLISTMLWDFPGQLNLSKDLEQRREGFIL